MEQRSFSPSAITWITPISWISRWAISACCTNSNQIILCGIIEDDERLIGMYQRAMKCAKYVPHIIATWGAEIWVQEKRAILGPEKWPNFMARWYVPQWELTLANKVLVTSYQFFKPCATMNNSILPAGNAMEEVAGQASLPHDRAIPIQNRPKFPHIWSIQFKGWDCALQLQNRSLDKSW